MKPSNSELSKATLKEKYLGQSVLSKASLKENGVQEKRHLKQWGYGYKDKLTQCQERTESTIRDRTGWLIHKKREGGVEKDASSCY